MYLNILAGGFVGCFRYISMRVIANEDSVSIKGAITISLLNQLADENHHFVESEIERDISERDGGVVWCISEFIPHSHLAIDLGRNTQYLKDDTLFFQVSVQTSDNRPWLKCN